MTELTLTLLQTDLQWQDAALNRRRLQEELENLQRPGDLILLPEMFTSAFSMEAGAIAEAWPGETLDWMRDMAARLDAALCGSIAVNDGGRRYNRLLFVTPDGEARRYDKRHLFRMLGEHERYSAGTGKLLLQWRGWRILPLVCYDLRFPVWCRNRAAEPYDLMLFVANWPAARSLAWSRLLCARAIENLAFVAGVNRIGIDGKGIAYEGQSAVYGPRGEEILQAGAAAGVFTATLDRQALEDYRRKFPAHLDADDFSLNL